LPRELVQVQAMGFPGERRHVEAQAVGEARHPVQLLLRQRGERLRIHAGAAASPCLSRAIQKKRMAEAIPKLLRARA
jgi:hypothetical protein